MCVDNGGEKEFEICQGCKQFSMKWPLHPVIKSALG